MLNTPDKAKALAVILCGDKDEQQIEKACENSR